MKSTKKGKAKPIQIFNCRQCRRCCEVKTRSGKRIAPGCLYPFGDMESLTKAKWDIMSALEADRDG